MMLQSDEHTSEGEECNGAKFDMMMLQSYEHIRGGGGAKVVSENSSILEYSFILILILIPRFSRGEVCGGA